MILHITNDYSGSKVYKNLVSKLDSEAIKQIIYTPIKSENSINKNFVQFKTKDSHIIYSNILNKYSDRIFYFHKIKKIERDIESKVELSKIKFIHAHTWYSDGGVGLMLHKKYDIPYIISVRSTDINLFWKIPYLKNYGLEILSKAHKVIFISEQLKYKAFIHFEIKSLINLKSCIIPNGVNDFWINNSIEERTIKNQECIKVLYIGTFIKRKNTINLIKAVIFLRKKFNIRLTLVGGGGNRHKEVIELVNKYTGTINYLGKVTLKKELLNIYRNHDIFAMPSKHETFGLVYVEALLQGLPILYTKNEGIDGLYDDNFGEAVEEGSISDITNKLTELIENFDFYNYNISKIKKNHNWNNISKKYIKIYSQCT